MRVFGVCGWEAGWLQSIKSLSEYPVASSCSSSRLAALRGSTSCNSPACGAEATRCWDAVGPTAGGQVKRALLRSARAVSEAQQTQGRSDPHSPEGKVLQVPSDSSLTSHTRAQQQKSLLHPQTCIQRLELIFTDCKTRAAGPARPASQSISGASPPSCATLWPLPLLLMTAAQVGPTSRG